MDPFWSVIWKSRSVFLLEHVNAAVLKLGKYWLVREEMAHIILRVTSALQRANLESATYVVRHESSCTSHEHPSGHWTLPFCTHMNCPCILGLGLLLPT